MVYTKGCDASMTFVRIPGGADIRKHTHAYIRLWMYLMNGRICTAAIYMAMPKDDSNSVQAP